MKLFKCAGCGHITTGDEWNKATKGDTDWLLTPIEVNTRAHFVCPGCGEWQWASTPPVQVSYRTLLNDAVLRVMPSVDKPKIEPETVPEVTPQTEHEMFPALHSFDTDSSWNAVTDILRKVTGKPCESVGTWRTMWETNKEELRAAFDATGRIAVPMVYNDDLDNAADYAYCIIRKYLNTLQDKGTIASSDRDSLLCILESMLLQKHSVLHIEEIKSNRLLVARPDPRRKDKMLQVGTKLGSYLQIALKAIIDRIKPVHTLIHHSRTDTNILVDAMVTGFSQATDSLKVNNGSTTWVVLSCNPLDMLLVSNATTGWDSCHSINKSYATGGAAYMLDKVSVIAYAYQSVHVYSSLNENITLPRKLWREMVYIDLNNKSALISREYPGLKPALASEVRRLVAKVIANITGCEYKWKVARLKEDAVSPPVSEADTSSRYSLERNASWSYKDSPTYRLRMTEGTSPVIRMSTEHLHCPNCGALRTRLNSATLLCSDCLNEHPCFACGTCRDVRFIASLDRYICQSCYHVLRGTCYRCNQSMAPEDALGSDNGHYYCASCYDREHFRCTYCEEMVHLDGRYETCDGDVCSNCFNANYGYCEHCGVAIHDDDSCGAYGERYCSDCFHQLFYTCYDCGEAISQDDAHTVNDHHYCDACASERFTECEVCNEFFDDTTITMLDRYGCTVEVCPTCYEQRDELQLSMPDAEEEDDICSIA